MKIRTNPKRKLIRFFNYPVSPRKGGEYWELLPINIEAYMKRTYRMNTHVRLVLHIKRDIETYLTEYPEATTVEMNSNMMYYLDGIKQRGGISDYRVNLHKEDSTKIDITLIPTRTIEQITLNFVIEQTPCQE